MTARFLVNTPAFKSAFRRIEPSPTKTRRTHRLALPESSSGRFAVSGISVCGSQHKQSRGIQQGNCRNCPSRARRFWQNQIRQTDPLPLCRRLLSRDSTGNSQARRSPFRVGNSRSRHRRTRRLRIGPRFKTDSPARADRCFRGAPNRVAPSNRRISHVETQSRIRN